MIYQDDATDLPTLKEAITYAASTNCLGILYCEKGRYGVIWYDVLGRHTTPLSNWNTNEDMLLMSRQQAKTAFHNLVSSGLVPLYVRYDSYDVSSRRKSNTISVKTPSEWEAANKIFNYEVPVLTLGDLDVGWMYYPSDSYLEDFAPTIARLRD